MKPTPWNNEGDKWPKEAFRMLDPPDGLEAAVLKRTSRLVKFRARQRAFGRWAALGVMYAAGILSALFWLESPSESQQKMVIETPPLPRRSVTPLALADLALTDQGSLDDLVLSIPKEERAKLLLEAGNHLLSQWGEVQGALRCYRRHLNLVPAKSRSQQRLSDNWLLASLRTERH